MDQAKEPAIVALASALPPTLTAPRYAYAEADRLARVSRGTAKRWLAGYGYRLGEQRVQRPPVTGAPRSAEAGVSFLDLIELAAIAGLRDMGWSLPQIRRIVAECRELFGAAYPLAHHQFRTDGREVFVSHEGQLVGLLGRKRERAWDEVLGPFLQTLEYDGGVAVRWFPQGVSGQIVIDPAYGFGMPVIEDTSIRTEIIAERFEAGELVATIADDLELTEEQVQRALQFELVHAMAHDPD